MEGLKLQVLCSLGEGDAGQGMGQGTGKMLKRGQGQTGRGHLLSFTHSNLAQPAPWAQEVGVASRGLCVQGRH